MQTKILQQKKYYGLNFWKVVMAILIVVGHTFPRYAKGYIGVEFFFLTSGFLLYISFKNKNRNTWQFLEGRIRTLYPDYIIALFLLCVFGFSLGFLKFSGSNFIAEVLMIQNIGIVDGGLNYPTWYVSVLMTAGIVVYVMLRKLNRKTYNIVSITLIITIICGYIALCGGRFEYWTNVAYVFCPIWFRGFMELLLGTLLAQLAEIITVRNKVVLFVFEALATVAFVMLLYCDVVALDFLAIPLCSLLVLISVNPYSFSGLIGKTKPVAKLSKFTYIIYLNQALAIYMLSYMKHLLVPNTFAENLICYTIFVFMIVVLPYLFKHFLKTTFSFFSQNKTIKRKQKIKSCN